MNTSPKMFFQILLITALLLPTIFDKAFAAEKMPKNCKKLQDRVVKLQAEAEKLGEEAAIVAGAGGGSSLKVTAKYHRKVEDLKVKQANIALEVEKSGCQKYWNSGSEWYVLVGYGVDSINEDMDPGYTECNKIWFSPAQLMAAIDEKYGSSSKEETKAAEEESKVKPEEVSLEGAVSSLFGSKNKEEPEKDASEKTKNTKKYVINDEQRGKDGKLSFIDLTIPDSALNGTEEVTLGLNQVCHSNECQIQFYRKEKECLQAFKSLESARIKAKKDQEKEKEKKFKKNYGGYE